MKLVILCLFICIGPLGTASGGDVAKVVLEEATQIVIGPTFGTSFNPTSEAVARIRDKKIIRQVLEVAVGKEPEEVDHYMLLPHLQVAVLNAKGEIIAAYALDRTPAHNSMGSRAVLRTAKVIQKDGKTAIDFKDMFKGFPCKALEIYRFVDQELPKLNGESGPRE
jgi:hypothetical protein